MKSKELSDVVIYYSCPNCGEQHNTRVRRDYFNSVLESKSYKLTMLVNPGCSKAEEIELVFEDENSWRISIPSYVKKK